MLRTPFDLPQMLVPGLAVPHLEVVAHAGDDDLAAEPDALGERRWNDHAALLVGLGLGGPAEEVPLHQTALPRERVEIREPLLDDALPVRARIAVEAPIHAVCENHAPGKRFAKLGRKGETALVIDRVLEGP